MHVFVCTKSIHLAFPHTICNALYCAFSLIKSSYLLPPPLLHPNTSSWTCKVPDLVSPTVSTDHTVSCIARMKYLDMDTTESCLADQAHDYPCDEAGQIEKVDAALLKMMMDWGYEDIQPHH